MAPKPDDNDAPNLALSTADYVASAARSIVGAVPFAGSLLVEIAGAIIPNQRLERIAKFAEALDRRLKVLEEEFVRSQTTDEHFTDLMEEGLRQAARAVSEERFEYIAELIARSLSQEEIDYTQSKHLLRLLGELNDVEVIRLGAYQYRTVGSGEAYRQRHAAVLAQTPAAFGSPQEEIDQETLHDSYRNHLGQLGLIEPRFEYEPEMKIPVIDTRTGGQKVRFYQLSPLGELLLREIDLIDPDAG